MMNLNDVKGIVEIDGLKFDPKDILRALVEQGLKVHSLNGTLLIGRSFIDQSPNIQIGEKACSMSTHCKIYDKLHSNSTSEIESTTSPSTLETQFDTLNQFPVDFQHEPSKAYVERVDIDNDDIDITNLFGSSTSQSPPHKSFQFSDVSSSEGSDLDVLENYVSEPTEMMGVSPLTKYGPSKMNLASIPRKYLGKCPNCGSTININWKFCGNCGNTQ
jgi:hypothetical protein